MRILLAGIKAIVLLAVSGVALAQGPGDPELSADEAQFLADIEAFMDSLEPQSGRIEIGRNLATLDLPDEFYFLDNAAATRVLVDVWGNPPGGYDELLGMLFPSRYTPFDEDSWAVTIEYIDDGHVSDADAAEIDYSDLLAQMKRDTRAGNSERVAAGYEPVELLGWAEPPHYDAGSHKLYWAKEVRFGDSPVNTLNYEIRSLGRTGILSMTFVASSDQLGEINRNREAVLEMASFNPGRRYEDFDSNIDKVAAYGIGALIAGKVAAKAGLLAKLGVLLLGAKKFLWIGLVAVFAFIRRLFSRGSAEETAPPEA